MGFATTNKVYNYYTNFVLTLHTIDINFESVVPFKDVQKSTVKLIQDLKNIVTSYNNIIQTSRTI